MSALFSNTLALLQDPAHGLDGAAPPADGALLRQVAQGRSSGGHLQGAGQGLHRRGDAQASAATTIGHLAVDSCLSRVVFDVVFRVFLEHPVPLRD